MKKIKIPKARIFALDYVKDGEIKQYKISLPIAVSREKITAYAFSRGVRSFNTSQIADLRELGPSLVQS